MQVPQSNDSYRSWRDKHAPRRVNWWLRMTSAGWDKPQETIEQRERTRRSQLLAWIVLGIAVTLLVFIPAASTSTPTLIILAIVISGLVLIAYLNRQGWITLAGVLLVMVSIWAALGVVMGSPDGYLHLVDLPAYDFEVLPVIISASILPRISAFIVASIAIALIYVDLILQKHAFDLQMEIQQYGIPVLAGRPAAIILITAVIAYLWVRGMDQAVKRADRAEELRALEQYLNQIETEHAARAREFVQETINAIGALANGQEGLLILPPGHPWEQQVIFINTQLKQFHKLKQAHRGSYQQILVATEMLSRQLQSIHSGQAPLSVLDPRRFTTRLSVTDEIARYVYFILREQLATERGFTRSAYKLPGKPALE
ncbi:MAG TPA: hypothetical protein VGD98_21475 [Ktedonobacteraceae bacterium]